MPQMVIIMSKLSHKILTIFPQNLNFSLQLNLFPQNLNFFLQLNLCSENFKIITRTSPTIAKNIIEAKKTWSKNSSSAASHWIGTALLKD